MKDICQEFYISKFNYIDSDDNLDIGFISPIQRRRLSKLDKYTVHTLKKTFPNEAENIIFASQNGQIERLLKLIEQYSDLGEVSPNTFAGSVHNYSTGFFLLNEKCSVPYTALSAGGNSLSAGMLSAVITDCKNVVYCFSDVYDEKVVSFSMNIGKEKTDCSDRYLIKLKQNNIEKDDYKEFIKLFSGQINKVSTHLYEIERVD